MLHQYRQGQNGGGGGGGHRVSSPSPPSAGNGYPGLRTPAFENGTYVLILLVVFIPVVFTVILCTITYCVYRYNKKRRERAPTNSPIVPVDRFGAPIATIIYNTQHSPFVFEESPPSYDSLTDIKKDARSTTSNTNEQFPLTILPNTHREVTGAATPVLPSAPSPSPSSYINLNESKQIADY